MHNVKKTPATEAHVAKEKRKREEKLKMFTTLRNQIFDKRDKDEYDAEILTLTGELLKKNPDIYTFWNIRRKTFLLFQNKKDEESNEEYNARIKNLFEDELSLTKEALLTNPKSYGAWHHRFWSFKNHPSPDLQKEINLCEKALSVDGRNFHVWDHRRSVAKLANLTDKDELKFSDKLIFDNPSNYSAWHYRATLLPRIRPDLDESAAYKMAIDENCLKEEFEKAKNVCCINSEDQTAWTYCRWLCEVAYSKEKCLRVAPKKCLEDLILFCNELIKIDKEEIPWEVIALARTKLFLTGPTLETVKEINKLFDKVKLLDPQRQGMYSDILKCIERKSIEYASKQFK